MRVMITVDLEGCAGVIANDPDQRDFQRRMMTDELNAAARGAFAGGATMVCGGESHANMRFIDPERLDPRVRFVSGQPKPLNHMAGIDGGFALALFVGYHAMSGALHGVMAHTFSSKNIFSVRLNGRELGEIGIDAALCGHFGVPVGLVTGDRATIDEARALLPGVTTVAVKEGLGYQSALCLPIAEARALVEAGATTAVRNARKAKRFVIRGPVRCEVVFQRPVLADAVAHLDFVERLDGRTIAFTGRDLVAAFERFSALQFLAPAIT